MMRPKWVRPLPTSRLESEAEVRVETVPEKYALLGYQSQLSPGRATMRSTALPEFFSVASVT